MKGPKRITIIDKIKSEKRLIPAPNHYKNLHRPKKVVNGKFDKTTGLSFLSEVEFLAKTQPGPTQYQPNLNATLNRSSAWKIYNPKIKEKTVKFKVPGAGAYNPQNCDQFSSTNINFSNQKYTFKKEIRGTSTEEEVMSSYFLFLLNKITLSFSLK